MPNPPSTQQEFHWQGRMDEEDGADGLRIHQIIEPMQVKDLPATSKAVSILGFACDAGVARNKGRIGARKAPDLIRRALGNMAWHQPTKLIDLGNVVCDDDLLEKAQSDCADIIAKALSTTPVITLGGGHEVAWASFQGLARCRFLFILAFLPARFHYNLQSLHSRYCQQTILLPLGQL